MPSALSSSGIAADEVDLAYPDLNHRDRELLRQINASVDRVYRSISDEPYVLNIPQDEPKFHHYSRHAADAWLINTPFDKHEDYHVQYQSWYYRDPYTDLFERVRSSQFDRTFKPALNAPAIQQPRSLTNTPTTGAKRKITLADYKNKTGDGQGALSARLEKEPQSQRPATADLAHLKAKEVAKVTRPSVATERAKPARDDIQDDARNRRGPKSEHHPVAPSASRSDLAKMKSPRKSPPPPSLKPSSVAARARSNQSRKDSTRDTVGRLSPLGNTYIARRLSPTLPPTILAALDDLSAEEAAIDNGQNEGTQARSNVARPGSKHDSVLSHSNDVVSEPPLLTSSKKDVGHDAVSTKPTYLIKLKIPKRYRQDLSRLLQFPPRAAKDPTTEKSSRGLPGPSPAESANRIGKQGSKRPPPLDDNTDPVKGLARKMTSTPKNGHPSENSPMPSVSAKRVRPPQDDHSQPQAKRQKLPTPLDLEKNPRTPAQPEFRSPGLPQSVMSQQATPKPRKEHPLTGLKHVDTANSPASTTPITQDRTPTSRPAAAATPQTNRPSFSTRPSPLSNAAKTPESQAWSAEHTRLGNLAKELKHISFPSPAKTQRTIDPSTIAHVESVLAFILSFYCADRALLCRDPKHIPDPANWVSCHAWYRLVLQRTQPHPHLYGIMSLLGIAYNAVIMRRYTTAGAKLDPANLQQAVSGALRCADQAALKMPLSVIRAEYPQTWKLGTLAAPAPASSSSEAKDIAPGRYEDGGAFGLVVGIQTDALHVVRLCHSLLSEWCVRVDPEYKLSLKLSL